MTAARLTGVCVAYDGRPVLSDVDLTVGQGEVVAILGANGSGKSTLVRTLLGLTPAATGTVELFDTPLERFKEWPRIGYVPQRPGATTGVPATVQEVVTSGRLPRMRRLRPRSKADREAIQHALEVVALTDRATHSVSELSGGQQQRVLIARALASDPELLVLDEPTAGVDLGAQQSLTDALAHLVREHGITIVLVAHELGPMAELIGRAVVLRDGHVVYDGPPPEIDHLHEFDPEHAHPPHLPVEARRSMGDWGLP